MFIKEIKSYILTTQKSLTLRGKYLMGGQILFSYQAKLECGLYYITFFLFSNGKCSIKILGACWYLLSIERQEACWRSVCDLEKSFCQYGYFDCHRVKDTLRVSWFIASNITNLCSPNAGFYPFGIYAAAMTSQVTSSAFFNKYFFCLWWGLRNLR